MGGVDEHALCHSGRTPRRAAAAASEAAGGAVLWGRKAGACEIMASRASFIGVASANTPGFGSLRSCIAQRCELARRQETCRCCGFVSQRRRATRPVGGFRIRQFYRANPIITMISSEGRAAMPQKDRRPRIRARLRPG